MARRVYAGAARTIVTDPRPYQGGLFRLQAGDGGWRRLGGGLPDDAEVRAILVHPRDPALVYAGTQHGPYRSRDGGERWERLALPPGPTEVWSLAADPGRPDTLYAGTAPEAVYRSTDGGDTWRRLDTLRAPGRVKMTFPTRVTRIAVDPADSAHLYVALEVDGLVRSLDGGATWEDCGAGLARLAERPHLRSRLLSDTEAEGMLDSHAVCVSPARPGTVLLAVRMGVFASADRGDTWTDLEVGRFSPLTYARDVAVSPHDPHALLACLSPASASQDGSLWLSPDLGATWRRLDHGVRAAQTMMAVSADPRAPGRIYCCTRAQVFGTEDGGRTWQEHPLPPDVRAVYAVACG